MGLTHYESMSLSRPDVVQKHLEQVELDKQVDQFGKRLKRYPAEGVFCTQNGCEGSDIWHGPKEFGQSWCTKCRTIMSTDIANVMCRIPLNPPSPDH